MYWILNVVTGPVGFPDEVATDLMGQLLCWQLRDVVHSRRITGAEAYAGPEDLALMLQMAEGQNATSQCLVILQSSMSISSTECTGC
jgi:3-methyladenine DNA glycosylase Mpg